MVKIKQFLNKNLLIIFLLFSLIGTSLIYLKLAVHNLSYPYALLAGLEDENIARTLMVLQGKSLYSSLTNYPFVVTYYPPAYYYITALFVKMFGVTLFSGRLLSLICSILVCFLCFAITRFLTKNFWWGIAASLLFMVSGFVQWWGIMFKNDIVAVFFGLAAIYLFLKFEKTNKYFLAVPFILLAVFTKQTFLSVPLAMAAYLFFSKKRDSQKLKRFTFLTFGSIALGFLLLIVTTRGQFFVDSVLVLKMIPWKFSIFKSLWAGTFYHYGLLLTLASGFVILERILYRETSLISWYFIFSLLARYDVGIYGSSNNYFMETLTLSAILAVLFINKIFSLSSLRTKIKKNKFWVDFSILALLFLVIQISIKCTPFISDKTYLLVALTVAGFWLVKYLSDKFNQKWKSGKIGLDVFLSIFIMAMFLVWSWQKFAGLTEVKYLIILLLAVFIDSVYKHTFLGRIKGATFLVFSLQLLFLTNLSFKIGPAMVATLKTPPPLASALSPHQRVIDEMVRDNPGRVLIDSESFIAIKNNRDFEYIPMTLKLRRLAGHWDFKKSIFYDDIGEQKFRFFIKSQGWTDPIIMYKIYEHYKLSKIVDVGAFYYEIFEPMEDDYVDEIAAMRLTLDEAEAEKFNATEVFIKKIDQEKYLAGFTFANDTVYGIAFLKIVKHPQFDSLYRPLHSADPNSSAIFKAKNFKEMEEIIATIFPEEEYAVLSK